MNYRSVVVYGEARPVDDPVEKRMALDAVTDHVVPGRSAHARPMSEREMRSTLVMALALDEASAKVRTGGPKDDDDDYSLPIWAGVIPISTVPGRPEPDERLALGVPVPGYVDDYRRP